MSKVVIGSTIMISIILLGFVFFSSIYATGLDVSANIGNNAPIISAINICSVSTCSATMAINPGSSFTIKLTVSDADGVNDLNLSSLVLQVYTATDVNNESTSNWDHFVLKANNSTLIRGNRDGCEESATNYCLHVDSNNWSVKFKAGTTKIFTNVSDLSNSKAYYLSSGLTVSQYVAMSLDATTISFTGSADTTNNPAVMGADKNQVTITNTGNVDLNFTAAESDLNSGTNTISASNIFIPGTPNTPFIDGGSPITGPQIVRGTQPTSGSLGIALMLNVPANTPKGNYTGTMTLNISAS